jgi:hypothetical protein
MWAWSVVLAVYAVVSVAGLWWLCRAALSAPVHNHEEGRRVGRCDGCDREAVR